jgi:hypothetical protein
MPDRSHHETKRLKAAFSLFPKVNAVKKIKTKQILIAIRQQISRHEFTPNTPRANVSHRE